MGEVYRAKDTKLGRDVALKLIPAAFTSDPERLARFRREAHVLASLNHRHIGAIYGLEESNRIQALLLELVEGPTLADRIAQGPIALDEALPLARQIAEALDAHEQGIIHRDLKPTNLSGDRHLMVVQVRTQFPLVLGDPKPLFATGIRGTIAIAAASNNNYAVTSDGQRFYINTSVEPSI
jgi:serine/threonine protein kinase